MSEVTKQLRGEQYLVTHSVGANQAGIRLDRFLMQRYRRRSREQLKKAIESGAITIQRSSSPHLNLGKIKPSISLQHGDIVQVLSIRRPEPEVNFNYKILFEDDDIVVIDKPPNLPVHPAGRFFFNTLLVHLKTHGFTTELESDRRYFLVHRIDKETSGVLLLAKSKEACNTLTSQFRKRETDKYYLAIVHGVPKEPAFDVAQAIGKIPGSRIGLKMYPLAEEKGGLPSHTHFELVETRVGVPPGVSGPELSKPRPFSLLACFPRTGRQHQIRIHADIAGVPLVGDKIYGMSDEDVLTLLDGHREEGRSFVSPDPAGDDETAGFEAKAEVTEATEIEDEPFPGDEENADEFNIAGPTASLYAELEARLLLPRHALHAAGLRFTHPRTGERMVFESDLPLDLRSFFESLNGTPLKPFRTVHW